MEQEWKKWNKSKRNGTRISKEEQELVKEWHKSKRNGTTVNKEMEQQLAKKWNKS